VPPTLTGTEGSAENSSHKRVILRCLSYLLGTVKDIMLRITDAPMRHGLPENTTDFRSPANCASGSCVCQHRASQNRIKRESPSTCLFFNQAGNIANEFFCL